MESKPEEGGRPGGDGAAGEAAQGRVDSVRAALLRIAVAHNRAVLAGTSIALFLAMTLAGGAVLVISRAGTGLIATPSCLALLSLGAWVGWKGIRLHRHLVRDLGVGRAAAAEVVTWLLAHGGSAPAAEIERAFGRERLLRALELLGPLGLGWIEGDRLMVDSARLGPGS